MQMIYELTVTDFTLVNAMRYVRKHSTSVEFMTVAGKVFDVMTTSTFCVYVHKSNRDC